MDELLDIPDLTEEERNIILKVIQRDETLQKQTEDKAHQLRDEIQTSRLKGVLRSGDDSSKICSRCRAQLGTLFNTGAMCQKCKFRVCKLCQHTLLSGGWLCTLCFKQVQLQWLTGEWMISAKPSGNEFRRSATSLVRASIYKASTRRRKNGNVTMITSDLSSTERNSNTDLSANEDETDIADGGQDNKIITIITRSRPLESDTSDESGNVTPISGSPILMTLQPVSKSDRTNSGSRNSLSPSSPSSRSTSPRSSQKNSPNVQRRSPNVQRSTPKKQLLSPDGDVTPRVRVRESSTPSSDSSGIKSLPSASGRSSPASVCSAQSSLSVSPTSKPRLIDLIADSHNDSSDTESLSKCSQISSTESAVKEHDSTSLEEYDIEELSQVRFQRVCKSSSNNRSSPEPGELELRCQDFVGVGRGWEGEDDISTIVPITDDSDIMPNVEVCFASPASLPACLLPLAACSTSSLFCPVHDACSVHDVDNRHGDGIDFSKYIGHGVTKHGQVIGGATGLEKVRRGGWAMPHSKASTVHTGQGSGSGDELYRNASALSCLTGSLESRSALAQLETAVLPTNKMPSVSALQSSPEAPHRSCMEVKISDTDTMPNKQNILSSERVGKSEICATGSSEPNVSADQQKYSKTSKLPSPVGKANNLFRMKLIAAEFSTSSPSAKSLILHTFSEVPSPDEHEISPGDNSEKPSMSYKHTLDPKSEFSSENSLQSSISKKSANATKIPQLKSKLFPTSSFDKSGSSSAGKLPSPPKEIASTGSGLSYSSEEKLAFTKSISKVNAGKIRSKIKQRLKTPHSNKPPKMTEHNKSTSIVVEKEDAPLHVLSDTVTSIDEELNVTGVNEEEFTAIGVDEKKVNVTGVVDMEFNVTGVDAKEFNVTGVDDTEFNVTGVDEKKVNVTGVVEMEFNVTGVDAKEFNVTGVDDTEFNVTGVDDTEFNVTGVDEKEFIVTSVDEKEFIVTSVDEKKFNVTSVDEKEFTVTGVDEKEFTVTGVDEKELSLQDTKSETAAVDTLSSKQTIIPSIRKKGSSPTKPRTSVATILQADSKVVIVQKSLNSPYKGRNLTAAVKDEVPSLTSHDKNQFVSRLPRLKDSFNSPGSYTLAYIDTELLQDIQRNEQDEINDADGGEVELKEQTSDEQREREIEELRATLTQILTPGMYKYSSPYQPRQASDLEDVNNFLEDDFFDDDLETVEVFTSSETSTRNIQPDSTSMMSDALSVIPEVSEPSSPSYDSDNSQCVTPKSYHWLGERNTSITEDDTALQQHMWDYNNQHVDKVATFDADLLSRDGKSLSFSLLEDLIRSAATEADQAQTASQYSLSFVPVAPLTDDAMCLTVKTSGIRDSCENVAEKLPGSGENSTRKASDNSYQTKELNDAVIMDHRLECKSMKDNDPTPEVQRNGNSLTLRVVEDQVCKTNRKSSGCVDAQIADMNTTNTVESTCNAESMENNGSTHRTEDDTYSDGDAQSIEGNHLNNDMISTEVTLHKYSELNNSKKDVEVDPPDSPIEKIFEEFKNKIMHEQHVVRQLLAADEGSLCTPSIDISPDPSSLSAPVSPSYSNDRQITEMEVASNGHPHAWKLPAVSTDGDSGNISGTSRENTPESVHQKFDVFQHKKNDSLVSAASSSNADKDSIDPSEEADEIEDLVETHRKNRGGNAGRFTNLLSAITDSKESIVSFYSNAGEGTYGHIPVTGEIMFGLDYNYKSGSLEVYIKQCRDIAAVDTKRNKSDPYVKTYLLPDKTKTSKRKTKVKKNTLNPTFDETLKYHVSKSELENRTLSVTVWNSDRLGRNDFLGEVTIPFDYYKFGNSTPQWFSLEQKEQETLSQSLSYQGDLIFSIMYANTEKSLSPVSKGKKKKGSTSIRGELHVLIKEAINLSAVKSSGTSDPFCKAYLLPDKGRGKKQKTPVIKNSCSPTWNHLFVFEDVLSVEELAGRCLELTIWDHDRLTSNDFLGGLRVNLGTGTQERVPVEWMDARGEEITMWQMVMDRPNEWVDGTLALRAHMNQQKY